MNLQEEKNKLETLQYFRREIEDRQMIIDHFNKMLEKKYAGFFAKLFRTFKLKIETAKTRCIDGDSIHIEMDIELQKDIIVAFEKSKLRLEELYKENASEFMETVNLK